MGKNGVAFKCIKFRSMVHNATTVKDNGKFNQTVKNDSRVTRVGAFLRKTNFDELPQFFNVLWGNMSIIDLHDHTQFSTVSKVKNKSIIIYLDTS